MHTMNPFADQAPTDRENQALVARAQSGDREATTLGHRRELDALVATLMEKYQLTLRHAKILSHDTDQAPPEQWTTGRQPGKG